MQESLASKLNKAVKDLVNENNIQNKD